MNTAGFEGLKPLARRRRRREAKELGRDDLISSLWPPGAKRLPARGFNPSFSFPPFSIRETTYDNT